MTRNSDLTPMQSFKPPFNKLHAVTAALALTLISANAQAVVVDTSATYSLNGGATNSFTESLDTDTSTASSVTVVGNDSSVDSSVSYRAFGNDTNAFVTSASGTGNYNVSSTVKYSDQYTNNSGSIQSYSLDFSVTPGSLSVTGSPTVGESVSAQYMLNIWVNGTSVFSSNASLTLDSSGASFSGDTALGGAYNPGSTAYLWDTYLGNVDLGEFADGETFLLEYGMSTIALGNASTQAANGPSSPNDIIVRDDECFECNDSNGSGSFFQIGDPFNINSNPTILNVSSIPTASVPEPSVYY